MGGRRSASRAGDDAEFRLLYARFREILSRNDSVLELIADLEDRLAAASPFAFSSLERRVGKASMDVFVMVKDLNVISRNRHGGLYDALHRINEELLRHLGVGAAGTDAPLVVSLLDAQPLAPALAGTKMAHLGEAGTRCGVTVPPGFVVTTAACLRFLSFAGLWERCEQLEEVVELHGPAAAGDACREVQAAIRTAPLPADLASAMADAWAEHFAPEDEVAVRSSAVGEDSPALSHAGLYASVLDVRRGELAGAYREVIASAFAPAAVTYRFERGVPLADSLMAVGCIRMLRPRCAGIVYSRPPTEPGLDAVLLSVTPGVGARLAAGEESAVTLRIVPGGSLPPAAGLVSADEVAGLAATARALEQHFGGPQDVEWAIDAAGRVQVLQSRALSVARAAEAGPAGGEPAGPDPWLRGGASASPGVDCGAVVQVRCDGDLDGFPEGGVLVARHSSPTFARVLARCAAVVTDVGSPTGHMASLAREFGVPAIVGLEGATRVLPAGAIVTVDADRCEVLAGAARKRRRASPPDRRRSASPLMARLASAARLVAPLSLTDPTAPEFRPEACRSLHDIARFVHEKAYEVVFHYGDLAGPGRVHSHRLAAPLPIEVRIFDVGGGLAGATRPRSSVTPSDVASVPMAAFLDGMLDSRLRWDHPRPVSVRGFLSVLGESMAGPPAEARQIGRLTYAIVSDRYMNFSTKAGYHFSTVDTYCGESQNKNYIHFRFAGGAADGSRRERRIRFLSAILSALDFSVQSRGDVLTARLDKYARDAIVARLAALGRLTMCARQLDMLMDDDESPAFFARAFLAGEWHVF